MEQHTHKCLKCKVEYKDTDPEAYLCESCLNERKLLAREVDMKIGSTVGQQPNGDLQEFDRIARERGGGSHVSIKDLGITL